MAIIKQTNKKNRKEQVLVRMCTAAVETVWWILKKLNIELPHDPVINFWVYNQKKWKQELKTGICNTHGQSSTVHNIQVSTDR